MKDQNIDLTNYFYKSQDYFEHLMRLKKKRWSGVVLKNNEKRKPIKKCIR